MKKVLSFVLVLSLVLSSFSMAFAGESNAKLSDVDGNANEVAIKVVNDLGIVTGYPDGTFKAEKAVTRAEFAVMLTKALNIPESALAGYTATSFTDVAGYEWAVPYLAFCESKGIISGYGEGIVKPGNTITVNEAMTMALRAIGLTPNSALLVGSWPSNYVTVAKSVDLYEDVAAIATVDRGSAAQIIYNALTVPSYVVNAEGNTSSDDPIIEDLAAGWRTGLVEYETDSLIPLAEYLGLFARTYVNDDGEIIAIDPLSKFVDVEIDANGDAEINGVEYKGVVNGNLTNAGLAFTAGAWVENGKASTAAVDLTVAGTYTLAVDTVGKTVTDIYSCVTWTSTADDMADEYTQDEVNDDKELLGQPFATNKNNEIDENSFQLLGVASLDKIAEDDVVYVYTDGNNIIRVEVGTEVVEGKITKVTYDADETTTYYAIGGKNYEIAAESDLTDTDLEVGHEGTFNLDYAGNIYAYTEESSLTGNYAVLIATDSATSFDETTYQLKMFTKDGTTVTPTVADKATPNALAATAVGTIVDYSLDKDGAVKEITTAAVWTPNLNGAVENDGTIIANKKVASNVVVFIKDGTDYSIGKVSDLADTVTVSAVVDDNEIVALLADVQYVGNTDTPFGIVTAYGATGLDADGEATVLADVILKGEVKKDVIVDSSAQPLTKSTTGGVALYVITVDEDGVITDTTTAGITTAGATTVKAIDGNTITLANTNSYRLAENVIVYIYDEEDGWYVANKISEVKKLTVVLCEVDDDNDGYEAVIAY